MWLLLLFILPTTLAFGWYIGHAHPTKRRREHQDDKRLADNYFLGLNYLINEQPDKAVEAFIKTLEVNSDTVEMHAALGSLFRRKGEVDRAICIHQNLIARPQLTIEQRTSALFELGQDYLRAGVLDRAEKIFLELVELNKANAANYKFLLHIYEIQKDWNQAIVIAQQMIDFTKEDGWMPIAHYYCELAEENLNRGLIDQAKLYLEKALGRYKKCVRASVLMGKIAEKSENYKEALKFYQKVKEQDEDFLSVVASHILACYEKLNKADEGVAFLHAALKDMHDDIVALTLARYLAKQYGDKAALNFLAEQKGSPGSMPLVQYLIELCQQNVDDPELPEHLGRTRKLLAVLSADKPLYRCSNCGLGTKQLYWQCPRCRRWDIIKSI